MDISGIIHDHYGLVVKKVEILSGGFRNHCLKVLMSSGKKHVFIIYKKEKGVKRTIENAHTVAQMLYKKNLVTRIPVKTKKGGYITRIKMTDGFRYAVLYPFLYGETIPWEGYTRRHLKSIGRTLSDLHFTCRHLLGTESNIQNVKNEIPKFLIYSTGKKEEVKNNRFRNIKKCVSLLPQWRDETKKEIDKMLKYFKKVEPWIIKKLHVKPRWSTITLVVEKLEKILIKINTQNCTILHYDFVRGNILFSKKLNKKYDIYPISGILDFEKVCLGPEIADIARSLAFLIIDCKFKDSETVKKRFLVSGYLKRGKNKIILNKSELGDLNFLLQFFWLRDFWKFLEHNPYEYLYLNEHYLRTRSQLITMKLFQFINK